MRYPNSDLELSRRTLLRQGALATGTAAVGVATFSGSAVASDCPRTPGFWANHDWCEVLVKSSDPTSNSVAESIGLDCECDMAPPCGEYELVGTGVSKTMEEWQEFLLKPPRGDKSIIMAKTRLATALNFQRRGPSDPDCVDAVLDLSRFGLGETTIRCVAMAAAEWLRESSFDDSAQRRWRPPTVDLALGCGDGDTTDSMTVGGEPLKDALDAFNNGRLGLDCDCR